MAIRAQEVAFLRFFNHPIPSENESATESEFFRCWIAMMKSQRTQAFIVAATNASSAEHFYELRFDLGASAIDGLIAAQSTSPSRRPFTFRP